MLIMFKPCKMLFSEITYLNVVTFPFCQTQNNRITKLRRILEETTESQSEIEIGERMRALSIQVSQSIQNIHDVFPRAIFIEMLRDFWDRLGQVSTVNFFLSFTFLLLGSQFYALIL